ncbi:MAG TPA: alcohol dehydrogenase catalytic domain-containing protein [Bryobacteraceae bacterium]|nr:alcohol dehydrogenase catalytic domain-containing protein [Bryobacteraceae bacterium]
MKAVVLRKPRVLEYMEVPAPKLTRAEEVLIEVKACGICGSDLRYWEGENPWALHTLGHHVDNPPNIIMGHEYAGVVVQVNSAGYEHLLGCPVGVQPYRVCGQCEFCRSGRHNLCKRTIHTGHAQGWGEMEFYPGAYAEYCVAWGDLVYPIPEGISFQEAAMADIFGVAVHAAGRARIPKGAAVLCIGGGPVGLSIAQVARVQGAGEVFVAETSPVAQTILGQFDLTVVDSGSLREALAAHLSRPEVAVIYDSVGSRETFTEAIPLLDVSGVYVNVAVHAASLAFNATQLGSERTLTTSSNAYYEDVRQAYDLIYTRQVRVGPMITHCLPLTEYAKAFDLLLSAPRQAYKVVLRPGL